MFKDKRCPHCNQKLLDIKEQGDATIKIKCSRCKKIVVIVVIVDKTYRARVL